MEHRVDRIQDPALIENHLIVEEAFAPEYNAGMVQKSQKLTDVRDLTCVEANRFEIGK